MLHFSGPFPGSEGGIEGNVLEEEKERILADFFESGMTEKAFSDLPCRPSRMSMRRWRAAAERGELEVPERRVAGRVDHC